MVTLHCDAGASISISPALVKRACVIVFELEKRDIMQNKGQTKQRAKSSVDPSIEEEAAAAEDDSLC